MEALQTLFQKGNELLADSIATLETADWTIELGFKYVKIFSEEEFAAFVFIKMRADILTFCSPERKQKVSEILQLLTADDLAHVDHFEELTDDADLRAILNKLTAQHIPDELNIFIKYIRDQTSKIFLPGTTDPMFPQNKNIMDILPGLREMGLAESEKTIVDRVKNEERKILTHSRGATEQKPDEETISEYVATHWRGSVYETVYGELPDEEKYKILKEASSVALCAKIKEKYMLPDLIKELRLLNPEIDAKVRAILGTNIETCPDLFADVGSYVKKLDELNAYIDEMATTDPYNQMVEVVLSNIEEAKKEKVFEENSPELVAGVTKLSRLTKARILNGKFNRFFQTVFLRNLKNYAQALNPYFSEVDKSVIFNYTTNVSGKANIKKIVYFLNIWPSILADIAKVNLLNEEHRKNASGKTDQEQKEELRTAKNIVITKLTEGLRNARADDKSPPFNLPRFGGKKTKKRKGSVHRSRKIIFF